MSFDDQEFVVLGDEDVEGFNDAGLLPLSTAEIQKIQKWLQPTDFNSESSEYNKHLASYAHGTGKWIQETEIYQQWRISSDYGMLWIKAVAGAGKSVVAAHLASHLGEEEMVPVLYFFFRQIITTNKSPRSLVRDWMSQLLSFSPLLQSTLKDLQKKNRTLETLAFNELWDMLGDALSSLPHVYCVADALDEMDLGNELFIRQLIQLGRRSPASVKVLITSRPLPRIEQVINDTSVLQIPLRLHLLDNDIDIYIRNRLRAVDIPHYEKTAMQQALRNKSQGLFLYARLMMDDLCDSGGLNIYSIDDTIHKLPSGLRDMYTKMLLDHSRRSGVPQELQLLILQCVTHSSRPLRLLEIATIIDFARKITNPTLTIQAVGVPQDTKSIVRAGCGPLLEIMEDETVSIIHHSFTEFLIDVERNAKSVNQFPAIDFEATHRNLALICLNYLLCDWYNDWDTTRRSNGALVWMKYPFLNYAISYWDYHLLKYNKGDADIFLKLDTLMEPGSKVFFSFLDLMGTDMGHDGVSAIHVASYKGLIHYTSHLLELGEDINNLDAKSRTPLHRAAEKGHREVVELLLKHGAASNMNSYDGLTPLHLAASRDHSKVAETLLQSGVDPFTPKTEENPGRRCGNATSTVGRSPVQFACEQGHTETVRTFIPFLDSDELSRALCWAAACGKSEVVLAILETSTIEVNKMLSGKTALHLAARAHDLQSMRGLLDKGADANIKCSTIFRSQRMRGIGPGDELRSTALHAYAAGFGHHPKNGLQDSLDGFKLLLAAGCDINEFDAYGETPLHQVLSGGNHRSSGSKTCPPEILTFLLENGADVSLTTKMGYAPLSLPVGDCADVIQLLIANGCDVNAQNAIDGRSPVFAALGSGENLMALMEHGTNCNVQDKEGDTPLHIAVRDFVRLPSSKIKLLLEHGADPNMRNKKGETPLHLAGVKSSWDEILPTLLAAKPDLEVQTDEGLTVLMMAVQSRQATNIENLIEAGAKLDACDFNGRTALHLACKSVESTELIRLLVKAGANPNQRDFAGNTILHQAARQYSSQLPDRQRELVESILELGVPPSSRNNVGQTPFHIAAGMSGRKGTVCQASDIFELLLGPKCNLDVNEADYRAVRPIHLAATLSDIHVGELLDRGADPLAITGDGQSVLHIAARARQSNVVGLMVDLYSRLGQKKLINHVDKEGRTALHYACRSGRFESVKILLDAGVDVNVKDSNSCTPLDMCNELQEENFHWSSRQLSGRREAYIDATCVTLDDPFRPRGEPNHDGSTARLDLLSGISSEIQTVGVRQIIRSLVTYGADVQFMFRIGEAKMVRCRRSTFEEAQASDCEVVVDELLTIAQSGTIVDKTTAEELQKRHYTYRNHFVESYVSLRAKSAPSLLHGGVQILHLHHRMLNALLMTENECGVEELKHMGVNMIEPGLQGESCLTTLARWGYASILEKVGAQAPLVDESWIEEMTKTHPHVRLEPILHTACKRNLPNLEVVKVLVDKLGVDVNCRCGIDGYTALHILAQSKHWWKSHAAEYLIANSADMEMKDNWGATALHIAVAYKARRTIEVLLERGANPNTLDSKNMSCLNKAVSDSRIVHQLIKYRADISSGKRPFIFDAIEAMDLPTVDLLIEMGADCNIRPERKMQKDADQGSHLLDSYPVHFAACMNMKTAECRSQMIQIIQSLLRSGANPLLPFNDDEDLILHDICECNGIIEPFLGLPMIDLETRDSKGRTPLLAACSAAPHKAHWARESLHFEYKVAEMLLENGADIKAIDCQGKNILHYLLTRGSHLYKSIFELVLSKTSGSSIAIQRDAAGWTPLHCALKSGALWAVDLLLDKGADPLEADPNGDTAIHHLASHLRYTERNPRKVDPLPGALFQQFLDFGVGINTCNSMGRTPVFCYFAQDSPYISNLGRLVEAGADLKVKDAKGQGLLHVVAKWNPNFKGITERGIVNPDSVVFKILMDKGLDPMEEDMKQRTALDIAAASQNMGILALFRRTT